MPEWNVCRVVCLFEFDPDFGAYFDVFGFLRIDPTQNRQHTIALVQINECGDERRLFSPAAERTVLHGVGMDAAFAAGFEPLEISRVAERADEPRVPVHPITARAFWQQELALFCTLPEWFGMLSVFRYRFVVSHCCLPVSVDANLQR